MPGAHVDLAVAARLGARALARRIAGRREPAPELQRFRAALEEGLALLPAGLVAAHEWIVLPAQEPPWRDTGMQLVAGEEITWLGVGRVHASRLLDLWVTPKNQIWTRIGVDGSIVSTTRDSHSLRAERPGRLFFGNYFPNDWKDEGGARLQDDSVYRSVSGETGLVVIRWRGTAREGLAALRTRADPGGAVSSELERIETPVRPPSGWQHLWHLGETEIFRDCQAPGGEPGIRCRVQGDVGILQRPADFPLAADTEVSWRWRVDALPGLLREDSVPSHDYVSLAVEFETGRDITYYWSRSLAPGTGFVCPLPNWKHREFHVVVRSGSEGLGRWHTETRAVHRDHARYMGPPPSRIVRIWLIANSVFLRRLGDACFAGIRLRGSGRELVVL